MDGALLKNMVYHSSKSDLIRTDILPLEGVDFRDCIPKRCRKQILDCSYSDSVGVPDVEDLYREFRTFIAVFFHFLTYTNISSKTSSIAKNKNVNIGGVSKGVERVPENQYLYILNSALVHTLHPQWY